MLREHFAVITRRTAPVGFDSEKPPGRINVEAGSRFECGNSAQRDAAECAEGTRTSREADRSGESLGDKPRSIPVMHRIRPNAVRLLLNELAPSATPDAETYAADISKLSSTRNG